MIKAQIEEIRSSPVRLVSSIDHPYEAFEVTLPQSCSMWGYIENPPTCIVGDLVVPEHLRRNGFGERLVRAFVVACKIRGLEHLQSGIFSETALGIRERVFGEKALQIWHPDIEEYAYELPITVEQAKQSIIRARERFDIIEATGVDPNFNYGLDVSVDLRGINVQGWEVPMETPS